MYFCFIDKKKFCFMILAPFLFTNTCDLNLYYLNIYRVIHPSVISHFLSAANS